MVSLVTIAVLLWTSTAYSAEMTSFPDANISEQRLQLRDVRIEWDAKGNPSRFTATATGDRLELKGLMFEMEISKDSKAPVERQTQRCGLFAVYDETVKQLPGIITGDFVRTTDTGKCAPGSLTFSIMEDAADVRYPVVKAAREAAKEKAEAAAETSRQNRMINTCKLIRARLGDKRIADLTTNQMDQISACKGLGLW